MTKTCPICGQEAEAGARQCRQCSNWFDEATWAPAPGECPICGKGYSKRGLPVHMARSHKDE